MKSDTLNLRMEARGEALCLSFSVGGKSHFHEKKYKFPELGQHMGGMLLTWVLSKLKPVFYQMPLGHITVQCSEADQKKIGGLIEKCLRILNETNTRIKDLPQGGGEGRDAHRILFFHVDGNDRYQALCNRFKSYRPELIAEADFSTGFNRKLRQWEGAKLPYTVEELIDFIHGESVGKIVSINHYLLETYLDKTGVYLMALFHPMGVAYIIFDNDNWDLSPGGYLFKSFFNWNDFPRYSTGFGHDYWDRALGMDNVQYVPVPQEYAVEKEPAQPLKEDYGVLILTHSRVDNVRSMINPLLFILSSFDPDDLFTEPPIWYFSLRHLILRVMELDDFQRLYYNAMLHQFFYNMMQLLKYEIIESIDTKRTVDIYGDQGWEQVFPEYYRNRYLSGEEIDGMLAGGSHIHLLINWSKTWLDASGPVYDAVSRNIPFLNCPVSVIGHDFSSLRRLEYRNGRELNAKIDEVQDIFQTEEIQNNLSRLKHIYTESMERVSHGILFENSSGITHSEYLRQRAAHNGILDEQIAGYIREKEGLLRDSFKYLFLESLQLDLTQSRFFKRSYIQNILKAKASN